MPPTGGPSLPCGIGALNTGGETVAGVSYTVIETRYDEVVTPYTSALLQDSAVTKVLLQADCPLDLSDHIAIIYDSVALQWVDHGARRGSYVVPAALSLTSSPRKQHRLDHFAAQ